MPAVVRPNLPASVEAFVRLALSCRNVTEVRLVGDLAAVLLTPGPSPETLAYHRRYLEYDRQAARRSRARERSGLTG